MYLFKHIENLPPKEIQKLDEEKIPSSKNPVLEDYRHSIDNMDGAFLFLLSERMRVIAKAGLLKKSFQIDFAQTKERKEDLKQVMVLSTKLDLDKALIQAILDRIFTESIELMNEYAMHPQQPHLEKNDLVTQLADIRKTLLYLDSAFCYLLAERFRLVEKVGEFKRQHNIQPLAAKRWQEILETKSKMAQKLGVKVDFVCDILNLIHEKALRIEKAIMA